MSRLTRRMKTHRLNLEMSEHVWRRLEELREYMHAGSMVEVIRKSLALYHYIWTEKKKGGTLIIKGDDGEKEVVIL